MNDTIIVALIEGVTTLLAVAIPSVIVAVAGFSFRRYRRIEAKYRTALSDLRFLLAVEHEHCLAHKEVTGESNRLRVRSIASAHHNWSGQFSISRIHKEMNYINKQKDITL
jgi:hypothetical protein